MSLVVAKLTEVRAPADWKQLFPMLPTPSGMTMEVRPEYLNAVCPREYDALASTAGSVMPVSFSHSSNALVPMAVTFALVSLKDAVDAKVTEVRFFAQ